MCFDVGDEASRSPIVFKAKLVEPGNLSRGWGPGGGNVPGEFRVWSLAVRRKMCGMFMRSAWKVTSSTNSAKVRNASQPFFCCRVCAAANYWELFHQASLLPILGQLASFFSKSVAIIARRPKRDFSFSLTSLYAISGLALTMYYSCSMTFFAFPSKCW